MSTSKSSDRSPLAIAELEKIYETRALSQVRANLSQIVEQVAISGDPVIVSKHNSPRAAIVPLSTLARARAEFVRNANLASEEETKLEIDDPDSDVDFEDVEGLSIEELRLEQQRLDETSREEDSVAQKVPTKLATGEGLSNELREQAREAASRLILKLKSVRCGSKVAETSKFPIALVGSNKLFQVGLDALLRDTQFKVLLAVERASDLSQLNDAIPRLILLHQSLNSISEYSEIKTLRDDYPEVPIVVIGHDLSTTTLSSYLSAGVSGYLMDCISLDTLNISLQLAIMGEKVFPTSLAALLTGEHDSSMLARTLEEPELVIREHVTKPEEELSTLLSQTFGKHGN